MSDDEADPELLELLRKSLGIGPKQTGIIAQTNVLRDAEHIYSNAIDVAINRNATVNAAQAIKNEIHRRSYSRAAWSEHELHPKTKDEQTLEFIFTMDLLNFSFWSELADDKRYSVSYRGKRWTGYWSLVACLQRALDEGIRITNPAYWLQSEEPLAVQNIQYPLVAPDKVLPQSDVDTSTAAESTKAATQAAADSSIEQDTVMQDPSQADLSTRVDNETSEVCLDQMQGQRSDASLHVTSNVVPPTAKMSIAEDHLTVKSMMHIFRGDGDEPMPMLSERFGVLREAAQVLNESFDGSVAVLVEKAEHSAGKLVNLLTHHFDCFRDEAKFDGKKVRFLKRAQIFVADVWAAFDGQGYGRFDDIDQVTMFADYRVPQQLHSLGCISFSPSLDYAIRSKRLIEPGSSWECQLRGCSIWVVELICRQIKADSPDTDVNAILIDFFLYDLAKEQEAAGVDMIPHHRTRSIWY